MQEADTMNTQDVISVHPGRECKRVCAPFGGLLGRIRRHTRVHCTEPLERGLQLKGDI